MRASLAAWEAVAFVQVAFQSCAYSRDDAKRRLRVWRRRWMRELVLDQQVKSNGALGQSSEAASALDQKLAEGMTTIRYAPCIFGDGSCMWLLKIAPCFSQMPPGKDILDRVPSQSMEIGT